jgi:hypothetical protein
MIVCVHADVPCIVISDFDDLQYMIGTLMYPQLVSLISSEICDE